MLKLTGPRSLSSATRTMLDVARGVILLVTVVFVIVFAAVLGVMAVNAFDPGFAAEIIEEIREEVALGDHALWGGAVLAVMTAGLAYLLVLLIITTELRRIFSTLARSNVFERKNGARLRTIGFALIALELASWLAAVAGRMLSDEEASFGPLINPTGWFSIAVVFILAEVFREGARLRRQSELTI